MSTVRAARAIVFDLDGTLVDTVHVRVSAWMDVFQRFDIDVDAAYLGGMIGYDGRRLARDAAVRAGRVLEPGIDAEIDRLAGERFSELNQRPVALPGTSEILEFLDAADMPWAIATSSRPEDAVISVAALNLVMAPFVIDGGDVEHAKPAPDLLLKAASRLGVDPIDTWYVGDATWDMLAAVAAGMVALGVATGATSEAGLSEAGAAAVFPDLTALLAFAAADALAPDRGRRELG